VQPFFLYDEPRPQDRPDAVGRVDAALLAEQLPADRDVDLYFLGPKPFMQAVHAAGLAAGVARSGCAGSSSARWKRCRPHEGSLAALGSGPERGPARALARPWARAWASC
jgi:NAD(P)H-flavin reductase